MEGFGALTAVLSTLLLCLVQGAVGDGKVNRVVSRPCYHHSSSGRAIYNFTLTDIHERENVTLDRFQGKFQLKITTERAPLFFKLKRKSLYSFF